MPWTHKERYCVLWVAPMMFCFCCYVKDPNAKCRFHEEVLMKGNLTLCNFGTNKIFVGRVEASRVIMRCHVRKGGRPGSLILEVLMWWRNTAMYFSDWNHMVQSICVFLRKDVNCGRYWVLMKCLIDICRLILGMLCMMGRRLGLCSIDVYVRNRW